MRATTLIEKYCAAYEARHGLQPRVVQIGTRHRFRVVNHRGEAGDYTARDIEFLTRGLQQLNAARSPES